MSETYTRNATADEVHDAFTSLFRDYAAAATIMPVSWVAGIITDLAVATRHESPGRRGDAMRRAQIDLHAALTEAHNRLPPNG